MFKMDEESDSSWDEVQTKDANANASVTSIDTVNEPQSVKKRKGWFSFLQHEETYPKYPPTLLKDNYPPLIDASLQKSVVQNSQQSNVTKNVVSDEMEKESAMDSKAEEVVCTSSERKEDSEVPVQLETSDDAISTISTSENLIEDTPTVLNQLEDIPPPLEEVPQTETNLQSPDMQSYYCSSHPDIYIDNKDTECIIDVPEEALMPEPSTMERLASTFVSDLWFWTTDIILSVSVISIVSCFTNLVWQGETA